MSTKTPRLDTGRSAEFADTAGGNGLALTFTEVNYTGGIQGFGAIADVTGVTLTFNLPVAGLVQFFGSGASLANPFTQGNYLGLAVNVNGTDYFLNGTGEQNYLGAGGGNLVVSGFTSGDAISAQKALNLPAGAYTVKLRAFGSGYLESSASFPTRLTVVYPVLTGPLAAASPITSLEAQNATGTPTTNATTTYAVIPNTLISFSLTGTQTVFLDGFATVQTPSTRYNTQIGIRIDGIDYDGPAVLVGTIFSTSDLAGLTVSKAISLAAGAHTAQLVLREAGGTGSAEVANSALKPSRLTALYTVPQSTPPADFAFVQATATGGEFDTFSATFVDVTGTTVNFSTLFTRNVIVKAQFTGIRNFADTDISAFYALNIDGTDYNMGGLKLSLAGGFNGFWVQSFEKIITLAPGAHTAVLRLKSNGSNNSRIKSDADAPTVVTVQYMA